MILRGAFFIWKFSRRFLFGDFRGDFRLSMIRFQKIQVVVFRLYIVDITRIRGIENLFAVRQMNMITAVRRIVRQLFRHYSNFMNAKTIKIIHPVQLIHVDLPLIRSRVQQGTRHPFATPPPKRGALLTECPRRRGEKVIAVNMRQQDEFQRRRVRHNPPRRKSAVNQDFIFHNHGVPGTSCANHCKMNHKSLNPILI